MIGPSATERAAPPWLAWSEGVRAAMAGRHPAACPLVAALGRLWQARMPPAASIIWTDAARGLCRVRRLANRAQPLDAKGRPLAVWGLVHRLETRLGMPSDEAVLTTTAALCAALRQAPDPLPYGTAFMLSRPALDAVRAAGFYQ